MTMIEVELVSSPGPRRVERHQLTLPAGSTVGDALRGAGVALGEQVLAVWGRRAALGQPLRDGDRIELLRPLQVDPKEARRLRARKQPPKTKRPAGAGR